MPVSWHSRLSVCSATVMLRIMVPSTDLPVALVSLAMRPSKPRLMSGGSIFSARIYRVLAASSTCVRSIFICALSRPGVFPRLRLHSPFAHGALFDVLENQVLHHQADDDH